MVDNTFVTRKSKIYNGLKQSQSNTVDESVVSEEPPLDSSVGEGALLKYQNLYKNAARMVEKQNIEGSQVNNPLLSYLSSVTKDKKAPKGFGLVHRKKKNEINL